MNVGSAIDNCVAATARGAGEKVGPLTIDVAKEIEDFAKERNDFVHALFTGNYVSAGYASPGFQTTSARRSKTGRLRPTTDLPVIRDRAARLSCLVAHVDYCIRQPASATRSAWAQTVDEFLQKHSS